jgi:hypothetical protein
MSMSFLSMVEAELPPGFRFHPRDDELICDYLAPKLGGKVGFSGRRPPMVDVDLNKVEPWDLPGESNSISPSIPLKFRSFCLLNCFLLVTSCTKLMCVCRERGRERIPYAQKGSFINLIFSPSNDRIYMISRLIFVLSF